MPRAWGRALVSKLRVSKGAALGDPLLRLYAFVFNATGRMIRERCVAEPLVSALSCCCFLQGAAPRATLSSVKASVLRMLLLASLALLGCESDDPDVERRGGEIPDSSSTGGDGAAPVGGSASGAVVPFCDALAVIQAKCQRCHGDPLTTGAPVPFLTYEDTQAPYYDTDKKFAEVMLSVVERDVMPYVSLNEGENPVMPPVQPLTATEKATLLGWLKQGALPVGRTDCP